MSSPNFLFASAYLLMALGISRLSDAIFLVKFGSVVHHYRCTMEEFSGHDPLEDVSLRDWKIICDSVVKAKQFAGGYYNHFYKSGKTHPRIELSEWDSTQNYMWDDKQFRYEERCVRTEIGNKVVKMIKSTQCLCTTFVKWFVTYGGEGGYMFLVEPGLRKGLGRLRVTGLFEPSAKLKEKNVKSFIHQLRRTVTKKNMIKSICKLRRVNLLRLCSALYDALSRKGILKIPQRNIIDLEKRCVRKVVLEKNMFRATAHFLPCATFVTEDNSRTEYSSVSFYALADALESGAVFIFFERNDEKLELRARITKIGGLLNPVKNTGQGRKAVAEDEETEEETEDESGSDDRGLEETSDEKLA